MQLASERRALKTERERENNRVATGIFRRREVNGGSRASIPACVTEVAGGKVYPVALNIPTLTRACTLAAEPRVCLFAGQPAATAEFAGTAVAGNSSGFFVIEKLSSRAATLIL